MLPLTVLPVYSLEVGEQQVKCVWLPPSPLFVPVAVYLSVFVCLGSAFIETMNNIIIITVHVI